MNAMREHDPAHLDDHQAADLVLGLLNEGERAAALEHAAACRACEARLRAHVGASQRAAFDRPGATPGVVPLRAPWYRSGVVLMAAAAALVVAGALPLMRRTDHAVTPGALPAPGEAVNTREGIPEDPHLTAGLAAYAAHDLALADRELTEARGLGSGEQMRRVYLADVRLRRGDARGALTLLRSLRWNEVPEPWRRDAAGMLAQALRRQGEGTSADSIEHALKTLDPGTPFVP